MHTRHRDIPARVTLLAEHLTRAIDAGDELLSLSLTVTEPSPGVGPRMLRNREARLQRFLRQARNLEVSLIAHVLQARRLTRELGRTGTPLRLIIEPFLAGTQPLVDAAAALADHELRGFHEGDDALAYARSRGLVSPDRAALMPVAVLEADEGFLIGGQVAVGVLSGLADAYLRALANQFGLTLEEDAVGEVGFGTEPGAPGHASAPQSAGRVGNSGDFASQLATARALLMAEASGSTAVGVDPYAGAAREPVLTPAPEALPSRAGSLLAALAEIRDQPPRAE